MSYNRQKNFIKSQKSKGYKKVQVYIPEAEYKLLQHMKQKTGKTFGEIISSSLVTQKRVFSSWTDKNFYFYPTSFYKS